MRLKDTFKTAYRGLLHAKVRSLLTMLGIVIGIGSVILLISIGNSAERLILNEVEELGSNLIFVIPGGTNSESEFSSPASVLGIIIKTLDKDDVVSLQREAAITAVAPEVRGEAKVVFESRDQDITFEGTSQEFFNIRDLEFKSGQPFTKSDIDSFNKVAVLGSEIAETLFRDRNPIGKVIRLKDISFRVVGVLEDAGLGPFGVDQDSLILLPVTVAQKQLLGIDYYNSLLIQSNEAYTTEFAEGRIEKVLRTNHRIFDNGKDDFTIRTQEDVLALFGSVTTILTIFLGAVASISLFVGGIGIMNIMLVSVVERTKEIGLRKALGATTADITLQFLIEAVLLTVIGGLIGIIGGAFLVVVVYFILVATLPTGWFFALPLSAIVLSVVVAGVVGIVFGLYPARQAAKKSPIEALRYE